VQNRLSRRTFLSTTLALPLSISVFGLKAANAQADLPIQHGARSQPMIALTFDACRSVHQAPGYDAALISVLDTLRVPATLFLGGLWMQAFPDVTRQLANNPLFELGQHSWDHPDFTRINATAMADQFTKTQSLMRQLTLRAATLMRFPYGRFSAMAISVALANGLTPVQWDVVSGDPSVQMTAPRLTSKVVSQTRNGSIIIMHMNRHGWHTAQALPEMIKQLRAKGFQFATVTDMLRTD